MTHIVSFTFVFSNKVSEIKAGNNGRTNLETPVIVFQPLTIVKEGISMIKPYKIYETGINGTFLIRRYTNNIIINKSTITLVTRNESLLCNKKDIFPIKPTQGQSR